MFTVSSRGFVAAIVLLALVVPLMAGSTAAADSGCKKVEGKVAMRPLDSGAVCSSPLGLCGEGAIKGDIKGSVFVTITNMLTSADTPATGVAFMTADTVFTTRDGILNSKDATTFSATGEYAEVITITGGTGRYQGATGTLTATGTTTTTGGSGAYSGIICVLEP